MSGVISNVGGILTGGTTTAGRELGAVSGQLPGTSQLSSLASGPLATIANQQYTTAQPLLSTGQNQFQTGAAGQLLPGMQQIVDNALHNADTLTNAHYAQMGLSGSSMQGQDLGQNRDQAAQLEANLAFQNEQIGMQAIQEGLGALAQSAGTNMNEASIYSNLAALQLSQNRDIMTALQNLANAQAGQQSNLMNLGTNVAQYFGGQAGGATSVSGDASIGGTTTTDLSGGTWSSG